MKKTRTSGKTEKQVTRIECGVGQSQAVRRRTSAMPKLQHSIRNWEEANGNWH
ncbi:hypothetical protein H6F86_11910 [Phormidium sp. FACHB-592]|uniref:Uncharacterized protein n=1 Tax=Stenomitos frigidus AS-A4 TaxID=2933935 RepID=A0ABV0KJN2_9CYAN|nr:MULTISPECIES: hypothetical protein [Cyanophyceae]MBD2037599.1 hypothetical protein [Leptolyngbya sp. FACHB-321]MBD2074579.1 hypothetical protein [Phormidium sp. FACHB-592]